MLAAGSTDTPIKDTVIYIYLQNTIFLYIYLISLDLVDLSLNANHFVVLLLILLLDLHYLVARKHVTVPEPRILLWTVALLLPPTAIADRKHAHHPE